ncbi:MAG: zinc carboxypeptidase [Bacteroidetes bacterium]|nr:zinc carboxypeptidase [Bacteroidota bacterium]
MQKSTYFFFCFVAIFFCTPAFSQDYFLKDKGPFNADIPSPEVFLGYPIGSHHTRYDQIVAYFKELAEFSDKASFAQYGTTYELRPLIMLTVTSPDNLNKLEQLRKDHLQLTDPNARISDISNMPVFINMGYGVHGNEPSSAEAAMLTAYILVASQSEAVLEYLEKSVLFIDPCINPDGRDRHTHWVNMHKGNPLVADPMDVEHNEAWPRGRTNHYWFDLNRDWILGIHPESRGKLKWYHEWYPNVVTDFHEMGSSSTYFFEPKKNNASKDPIMPKENYTTLNETFARYFKEDMDAIGSFYFTKDVFDGSYPGYGSSYPDLQGALALLFEQASSRGHVQETATGDLTFAFTIRNQLTTGLATIRAAVENKELMLRYQQDFFKSALNNSSNSKVKAYVFGDSKDENRTRAFIDKLLIHKVKVHQLKESFSKKGKTFKTESAYLVPTDQSQYRIVQTMFETYEEYADSVYYDASAWSIANFYNMPYVEITSSFKLGKEVTVESNKTGVPDFQKSNYAYLIPWEDYYAPALLYHLESNGAVVTAAFKPFSASVDGKKRTFDYGTLMVPVQSRQKLPPDSIYHLLQYATNKFKVEILPINTGYSLEGIDLGSGHFRVLEKPKAVLLVGEGVSSYEAGEVWHLLDTRMQMPITKVPLRNLNRLDLEKYNALVMVSGQYAQLDSLKRNKIKTWVSKGNTLITIRDASAWAIRNRMVKETLVKEKKKSEKEKDENVERLPYVGASENIGKNRVGGSIFEVKLDLTHPLAFGYTFSEIPVYRNSTVWIAPSKNPYSTIAKYTDDPHIDGFITEKNLKEFLTPSASLIVSPVGSGRAILFADNPNFRGSWYGTNRLFLNALFFGKHIRVPKDR